MCFVRLKTPLLEKTNRLSPVSSTVSECCSQGPVSADGCPSLREKRRIKKERQNMSNKQEKCKLRERGKLNVMTCGGGKVKRGEWRRSALCMMGSPPAAWVYKDGSASPDPALTTSFIQKERKDKASTCRVFSLSYSADCLLTVHQTLQNRPTSC